MLWPLWQLLWSMLVAQEWGQEQEKEMQTWILPLPFHPPDDKEKKSLLFKNVEIKIEKIIEIMILQGNENEKNNKNERKSYPR